MAGGCEKARLGDVGVLGRALGERSSELRRVSSSGAVADALFQRRIGALQRFGRLDRRRHVGEGDDKAAIGHAVGAHLDHHMAVGQALQMRLALGGVGGKPPAHLAVGEPAVSGPVLADLADEFEDFPQGNTDLRQMRRQPQKLAASLVRADQLQLGVEHGNALPHMVQRGLQDLAVEMHRGVSKSSSSFSAALADTVRLRSSSDITRREGRRRSMTQSDARHAAADRNRRARPDRA